ncbi:MAG: M4 family metallopeptidase, partial [Acidobacteria bacterium]|nr:M4 family metallopeptidase [Acidobacteriota bacterium]
MCLSFRHRNPLHCILPPHVLTEVAKGSDAAALAALRTLNLDMTFRAMRSLPQAPAAPAIGTAAVAGQPNRTVHSANNAETLPGVVKRTEGQPDTGDVAVDEAYKGLGATYALFFEAYGRDSIDDEGMPLLATVHYGNQYNNAFWNGQQMVFGDGDGELFNRFTIAIDVIGHELTHGVVEDEGPLYYVTQSGALNESLADVFGSLVKKQTLNQKADQADWLVGQGLFTANVN